MTLQRNAGVHCDANKPFESEDLDRWDLPAYSNLSVLTWQYRCRSRVHTFSDDKDKEVRFSFAGLKLDTSPATPRYSSIFRGADV